MFQGQRLGVVIPAQNEEQSIGTVVSSVLAQRNEDQSRIVDHLVVCSNNSTDNTSCIARSQGAEVVEEPVSGYGRACLTALSCLRQHNPDVILFIDGDCAFDAADISRFMVEHLRGADLVIGSRSLGEAADGSISVPQLIGNRLASFLIWLLWRTKVTDLGPYRSITNKALDVIQMADEAYGWTVEMQIKAIQRNLKMVEIPVNTNVRVGKSKISGTLRGVIGAGLGIISKILVLRFVR